MKIKISYLLLLTVLITSCNGKIQSKIYTGSSLAPDGTVSNTSTEFSFPPFKKTGTSEDLFNYLYFKGDTYCFSTAVEPGYSKKSVTVTYTHEESQISVTPERIDFHKNRISGFSLIGTLMEQFNSRELINPIPEDAWCCTRFPVTVTVEYIVKGKVIKKTEPSWFLIRYD